MTDHFRQHSSGLESPAADAFNITPSDGSDLTTVTRALNVAQTGSVRLATVAGTITTVHIAAGTVFPIRATRVYATGTDAIGIVGLY